MGSRAVGTGGDGDCSRGQGERLEMVTLVGDADEAFGGVSRDRPRDRHRGTCPCPADGDFGSAFDRSSPARPDRVGEADANPAAQRLSGNGPRCADANDAIEAGSLMGGQRRGDAAYVGAREKGAAGRGKALGDGRRHGGGDDARQPVLDGDGGEWRRIGVVGDEHVVPGQRGDADGATVRAEMSSAVDAKGHQRTFGEQHQPGSGADLTDGIERDTHQTGVQVPRIRGDASVFQARAAATPAAASNATSTIRATREGIGGV